MGDLSDYAPQITTMRDDRKAFKPGGRVEMSDAEVVGLGSGAVQVGRRGAAVRVIRGDSSTGGRVTGTELIPVAGASAAPSEVVPAPVERAVAMVVPHEIPPAFYSGPPSASAVPMVIPTSFPSPKVKVSIASAATGKMTLFCTGVAVSESILVIQYPADGQTAIYEPPVTDETDPLRVTTPEGTYRCLSLGFSVELGGQYLVILVRLPDSAAALG